MTPTQFEPIVTALQTQAPQASYVLLIVGLFSLIVGSFFNVVIYRLSLQMQGFSSKEMSTTKPAKSFCPSCKKTLNWSENIPVISYLIQLGRCRGCKTNISLQYPLVEMASVAIALLAWTKCDTLWDTLSAIVFLDILLITAVIDARTKKIPNKLTIPGTIALLALSFAPGGISPKDAFIGAMVCFLFMWGLAELGKKMFGKKTIVLKKAQVFIWENKGLRVQDDENTSLEESELMSGTDLPFNRESDRITLTGQMERIQNDGTRQQMITVDIAHDDNSTIRGEIKTITFPREAMGMGDAKLLLLSGASLGFLDSVHGLVVGTLVALLAVVGMRIVAIAKKGNAPGLIAFGPWIAIGCAAVWLWRNAPV